MTDKAGFLNKKEFYRDGNSIYKKYKINQDEFLLKHKNLIPQEYIRKWPINKLAWWSRPFEYDFVIEEIKAINDFSTTPLKILELGPGCSFFTDLISKSDNVDEYHIIDNDFNVVKFWKEVSNKIKPKEIENLDLDYYDLIISISVFEHIENRLEIFESLIKSLKKRGKILLTLDFDFNQKNNFGLNKDELQKLLKNKKLNSIDNQDFNKVFKPRVGYEVFPLKISLISIFKRTIKKYYNLYNNNFNIGMYRYKGIKK